MRISGGGSSGPKGSCRPNLRDGVCEIGEVVHANRNPNRSAQECPYRDIRRRESAGGRLESRGANPVGKGPPLGNPNLPKSSNPELVAAWKAGKSGGKAGPQIAEYQVGPESAPEPLRNMRDPRDDSWNQKPCTVFVKNLPHELDERTIIEYFNELGAADKSQSKNISAIRFIYQNQDGGMRVRTNSAYFLYGSPAHAEFAAAYLHGSQIPPTNVKLTVINSDQEIYLEPGRENQLGGTRWGGDIWRCPDDPA